MVALRYFMLRAAAVGRSRLGTACRRLSGRGPGAEEGRLPTTDDDGRPLVDMSRSAYSHGTSNILSSDGPQVNTISAFNAKGA